VKDNSVSFVKDVHQDLFETPVMKAVFLGLRSELGLRINKYDRGLRGSDYSCTEGMTKGD
jgi:hypothetical protein